MFRNRILSVAAIPVLLLVSVSLFAGGRQEPSTPDRPIVVTSFTVLQDFARMVAGDLLDVRTITPVGGEVHEWELIPSNFMDLEQASLMLYNGLDLEEWMGQVRATVQSGVRVVGVAERTGFPTIPIRIGELTGNPDPHVWMNPMAAIEYIEVIREELSTLAPEHADTFASNAQAAQTRIRDTASELRARMDALPSDSRTLITSEAAFLYFADFFGLEHDAIWGSNDEEEGTPGQIARVVTLIRERGVGVAFHESTISDRHVRAVAEETGVRVSGPLFVDSTGQAGSGAETYIGMLQSNIDLILRELSSQ